MSKQRHYLAGDSGVSAIRLPGYIEGSKKITMLDKGKLTSHLTKLAEMSENIGELDEDVVHTYNTFKNSGW